MADITPNAPKKQEKGLFGGSLLLKIFALTIVLLVITIFLFGVELTIPSLLWTFLRVLVIVVLIVLIVKGLESFMKAPTFSPTRRFKDKMIRVAKISKPFNVKEVYLRGEDMRVYSKWGNVTGLAFIPYLASKLLTDKDGKFIYEQKKDHNNKPVFDDEGKPVMQNARDFLTEKDGDWFIVAERGLPLFKQTDLIRCHHSLISEIGEKIWIKAPNLVPIGDYFYPSIQWQSDIKRIKLQHQAEALVETYQEFLDLVANITQMTLNADPNFQKIQQSNTEQVGQQDNTGLMR